LTLTLIFHWFIFYTAKVIPVLVVAHVSVIQCLLSYFTNSPIRECSSIEVPLHSVIQLIPTKGASWQKKVVQLVEQEEDLFSTTEINSDYDEFENLSLTSPPTSPAMPIWGDHATLSKHNSRKFFRG